MHTTQAIQQTALRSTWFLRRDLDDVEEIECSTQQPWCRAEILETLEHSDHVGIVAATPEQVVGWMVYRLHSQHASVRRIAVHPHFRRAGVGKFMVGELLTKLGHWQRTGRRHFIRVDVPEDALGTHLFFRALGFDAHCHGGKYRFENWGA